MMWKMFQAGNLDHTFLSEKKKRGSDCLRLKTRQGFKISFLFNGSLSSQKEVQ